MIKIPQKPCLITALESDVGMGRSMEVYYQNLQNSKIIFPIMVYTREYSYSHAPDWVKNKVLSPLKEVDHEIADCEREFCQKPKSEHVTSQQWLKECINYIIFLRKLFGERIIWVLDMVVPEIEFYMGKHIVQVFHGELFEYGKGYFTSHTNSSFQYYSLMLFHGQLSKNKMLAKTGISPSDPRIKIIGRVLNDTLYNGQIKRRDILSEYGLSVQQKTVLYAPSWNSKKIWPIGERREDIGHLQQLCAFLKSRNVNLIVRPHTISIHHYNVKKDYLSALKGFKNVYFDDATYSNILGPNKSLVAADIMVTDLSSIATDFLSLGKPVIFVYPDITSGFWDNIIPYEEVSRVSYSVRNFEDLFKTLEKLLTTRENRRVIQNRRLFSAYTLAFTDGVSGRRFRKEIESYAREMGPKNYLNPIYLRKYLQFWQKFENRHPIQLTMQLNGI